jgi:tetratricopeptide (TPR) repeat protein
MRFPLLSALVFLAGCSSLPEGRFEGTGPHTRKVTTASVEAQEWFDQGLAFYYAFNHDEAIRSFQRATEVDPKCAMAWWGLALANGPHINNPIVDETHATAAWNALLKAKELAPGASGVEKELIGALGFRYSLPQPQDRSPLDTAYAEAMKVVWSRNPEDADVGALAAEAQMDLHPWDLWTPAGAAQAWTPEIVKILETVIGIAPRHPMAIHLYIHAVEASPKPGSADSAADRLRDLCPGLGHLVHMPSHIDVRRGRWAQAIAANERAIKADAAYVARAKPPGFYRVYMAHNRHMRAFACMMSGRSAEAAESLRTMIAEIPPEFAKENAIFVDGFMASPFEVQVRFGKWEEMLAEPEPAEYFPISRAFWRFCRATSLAALGRLVEARAEQELFRTAKARVPEQAFFGNNGAHDLLTIAAEQLEGELLFREGRKDESLAHLRAGVAREDALRYDEPPDWIIPVRHSLGAVLLATGKAQEAHGVYEEDLQRWPENGWALKGLEKSLRAENRDAEAEAVLARFARVWEGADIETGSSCLCLPK